MREHHRLIARYRYNGFGERIEKDTREGTVVFHYDRFGRLLSETTAQGTVLRDYLYRGRVPLAQIDRGDSGWIRSPDGKLSLLGGRRGPDRILYLHTDYEGTPRVATDASGRVVWRWNGNAFGTSRPTGGRIQPADDDAHSDHSISRPIAAINLRYPGQYYDQETGFFYNGARYYDPKTGRYVSSDPTGLLGGINTYAYVGNDPLGYVDPLGLFPNWAEIAGPITMGAGAVTIWNASAMVVLAPLAPEIGLGLLAGGFALSVYGVYQGFNEGNNAIQQAQNAANQMNNQFQQQQKQLNNLCPQ